MDVEVRSSGNPMALLPEIRRIMRDVNPDAPIQNPMVLKTQFEKSYETQALVARLGAFFGGLATMLVATGLYGTLTYRVNRRVMEIGLRMALGATRSQVLRMVVHDSLAVTAGGLFAGLLLAWIGSKLIASMLYQMSPHDPASFLAAAGAVILVSVVAAFFPELRAARLDPMQALRAE